MLCEGKHDKYMVEDILKKKFSGSKVLNAEAYRKIHAFIRSRREGLIVYVCQGKPNIYRALNDLASQFLRYRNIDSMCVIVDEDRGKPIEDIENRLRGYLFDKSKFPSEKPAISRDARGFLLSYRGFHLRVWVVVVPGSLEGEVRAALRSENVDYRKLDYLNLFRNRKWFEELVEILTYMVW